MKTEDHFTKLPVATELGEFVACYSAQGLAKLSFPAEAPDRPPADIPPTSPQIRSWHRLTVGAVKAVLAGTAVIEWPPLDLSAGTAFQTAVWEAMRKIPTGKTRTYGEIARAVGQPKAVRAVGGACGANPIPVLVPCHRVLAAKHRIGGFSGGLNWKRQLLKREGITFD